MDCSADVVELDLPVAPELPEKVQAHLRSADFVRLPLTCISAVTRISAEPNFSVADGVVTPDGTALLSSQQFFLSQRSYHIQ